MKSFGNCPTAVFVFSLLCGAAFAAGQLKETIASSRSVPTDALPPFGMLDDAGKLVPLPTPAQLASMLGPPPAAPAPARIIPGPSLDLATEAARTAVEACRRRGFLIAVAVVNAEGAPLAMLAAEGSDGSVFVAMRKAVTTLTFRQPSSEVGAALAKDAAMVKRMTPVMFISGGALPLWHGQELIGAIASSGAHGEGPIGTQDEICAQAGFDKIKARLD